MQNKTIYYSILESGGVDIVINIDGHDKGNYRYCSLEVVKRLYPVSEYQYINLEE